jgi:predicted ATP-binding protein involved in virulence
LRRGSLRIDAIELKNFRGFETFHRKVGPGINVLVGENGTGKTAILDALAIGAGSFFLGVDGVSARGIQRDDVRVVVRNVGETVEAVPQCPVALTFEGAVFGQNHRWTRRLAGRSRKTTHAGASTLSAAVEARMLELQKGAAETLPLIAYHGTGRLWMQRRVPGSNRAHGSTPTRAASRRPRMRRAS